ncbi:sushi, von Willebrand factor type A, EGF and pentraxin domain-containing protein 1, partial [Nephila pilipes]
VDECSDDKLNRCDHDCLNFEGGYNCSCRPGYVSLGDFRCEPCRTNSYKSVNNLACVDCPAHSYTNGGGKTSIEDCFCNSGFSGNLADNVPCQDINECATENFGCSDICSNTLGSAHCACPPGFELQEDHKTCKDIDECSLKNGGCDGICHNTVGNFSCTCLKGYIASNRDRYSCDDVDECEEKNAGCSDTCINFQGGYHCACPEGYHLHPNGKNCVAVHCPRVYVPHHSLLKCKNGLTTNRVEYKPGQVPEDTEFPMGTLCRVKCSRGYELDTDPTIICENDGHWNATLPQCKVLQCPPLIPPVNGDVYPPSCKEGSTAVKEKCVFTCLPGYRITGQEVITCKNRLAWDFKKSTVCTPETNPYISCPDDVTTELPTNTSSIEMTLDSPRTNIKQVRISPEWVFVNRPTLFPAGETVVTFTVEDESGNKTNECSMSIFIVDKEPPEFYDCPETIHVIGSNTGTAVDWDEPVAFDNVGIATVFKSIEPNTTLTLGVHFVEYVARDIAGNAAECRFRINITSEGGCTDLADPENGEANCIDWIFGKICQPSCRLNYTRAEEEPEYFACDESGTWTPTSFISPCYPECSQDEFWSPELEECIGNYTKSKANPTIHAHSSMTKVNKHPLKSSARQRTSKFMPRKDCPYVILNQRSPTIFELANPEDPDVPNGVYHTSVLCPHQDPSTKPLTPLRKRDRPRKTSWLLAESGQGQRGRL